VVSHWRQAAIENKKQTIKLKIQFGPETRYDQPIQRMNQARLQQSPSVWITLRAAAMVGLTKPIKPDLAGEIVPEDSSP
jgi:hypothetical protein